MKPPICRHCLEEELIRIAKTIPMPDRGVLVEAAVDCKRRRGCVHLALQGEAANLRGLWAWTACGKDGGHLSTCAKREHVTCELCLRRADRALKSQIEAQRRLGDADA